jgi:hypothetical protein
MHLVTQTMWDVQPWAHECETIDSIKHNAQMFQNQYLELPKAIKVAILRNSVKQNYQT